MNEVRPMNQYFDVEIHDREEDHVARDPIEWDAC